MTTMPIETDTWLAARYARGIASSTVRSNMAHLTPLLRTCGDLPLRDLTEEHLDQWLMSRGTEVKPQTIANEVATVRAFLTWCRKRDLINPALDIDLRYRARVTPRERARIPARDFPRLLDLATDPRDRVLIALGLYTCCRASEITSIRVGDVSLADRRINVTIPKTNDRDQVPVMGELDDELRRWLIHYQEECGTLQPDWYLIPHRGIPVGSYDGDDRWRFTASSGSITPNRRLAAPYNPIKRVLAAYGLPMRDESGGSTMEGAHTLRRSGARALFDALCDSDTGRDRALQIVKTMLHHKHASMTERYLGLAEEREHRDALLMGARLLTADNSNVINLRDTTTG